MGDKEKFFLDRGKAETKENMTKISKEEFFNIIFAAIRVIMNGRPITRQLKKTIYAFYKSEDKAYYKEIAQIDVDALYEIDCKYKEMLLYRNLTAKQ